MEAQPAPLPAPPLALPVRGTDKIWSMFCHLSVFTGIGFLLIPLVIYLAMKDDSEYVKDNAREALNFHISTLIYGFCCVPLCFIVIGFFLAWALGLFVVIMAIVATIKASDGRCYHYPLSIRLIK